MKKLFTLRMGNVFKIREDFAEGLSVRLLYLFSVILGVALILLSCGKYHIFLKFLLFPLIFILVLSALLFAVFNINKIDFKKERINCLIILFLLVACILNSSFFYEYKIEAGHDQGVYFENALLLSRTGSYYQDYSNKYFLLSIPPNKVYENNLTRSNFIPGTAVYFSFFYHIFGLKGFSVALSFSLFFSILIIYFLCKKLRNWKTGLCFILFFLFHYYTIYFSRATWSENIQLLFIWFYVYLSVKGIKERSIKQLLYASLPLFLLVFFRLETILYIAIYLIVLSYLLIFRKGELNLDLKSLLPALFPLLFSFLLLTSMFIFDKDIMLNDTESPLSIITRALKDLTPELAWGPKVLVPYNPQLFIWVSLFYMFGFSFLLILILSILNFFGESKETKKDVITISALISPQFLFLIRPSIQLYIPWAMRRFWGVFIPYAFILFSLFVTNSNNFLRRRHKRLFTVFLVLIFLASSLPAFKVLFFAEGKGILDFEKNVASNFTQDDLVVFLDRYGYENFGPPLYFLYGTNVVFNRYPIFDKQLYALFMKDFKNVYIMTSREPNETLDGYFEGNITHIKTIKSDKFTIFSPAVCHLNNFAVEPQSFKGYYQIQELCTKNNPLTEITNYQVNLNIYKINESFVENFVKQNYNLSYIRKGKSYWRVGEG